MTTKDNSITQEQFIKLALLGLIILILFAAGFFWLDKEVLGNGEGELFLAYAPFWVYPYLVVVSVYVGFFVARYAKGRRRHAWIWGIAGFTLTLLFILGFPGLLSPIFPFKSPEIFAGPAIFAFLAPMLSSLIMLLLIPNRKNPTKCW
jgi:apolipoprotein N-acyltransferase